MTTPWLTSFCAAIEETVRPAADVETTNWTQSVGTTLWQTLDDNSDGDFVSSDESTTNCSIGWSEFDFEVGLGNPGGDVGDSACQGMRIRYRSRKVEAAGSGTVEIQVELLEGATVRYSDSFSAKGTSFSTTTRTLSDAQVDSIGNHDNLSVRVTARICRASGGLDFVTADVSWVELEYFAK